MRKWHRWVGMLTSIILGFLAITGVAMQIENLSAGTLPPGAPPEAYPAGTLREGDDDGSRITAHAESLEVLLARAARTVAAEAPGGAVESVQVNLDSNRMVAMVRKDGAPPKRISVDLATGKLASPPKQVGAFHQLFQNLHGLYVFGRVGQWISLAVGLSLVALSVTGLYLYTQMYWRRFKMGRKEMFF